MSRISVKCLILYISPTNRPTHYYYCCFPFNHINFFQTTNWITFPLVGCELNAISSEWWVIPFIFFVGDDFGSRFIGLFTPHTRGALITDVNVNVFGNGMKLTTTCHHHLSLGMAISIISRASLNLGV